VGKVAIGSRLRMLIEKVTSDATHIYSLYNIDLQPKWFPVFYVLSQGEEKTITSIAKEIGHSHPSVSKIISKNVGLSINSRQKCWVFISQGYYWKSLNHWDFQKFISKVILN
jgi:hypothetical protein